MVVLAVDLVWVEIVVVFEEKFDHQSLSVASIVILLLAVREDHSI